MTMNNAPVKATYRRPIRSDREPTNGQIAARASKLAKTYLPLAEISLVIMKPCNTYKPDPSIRSSNITIDVGGNAAEDVNGNLRAGPEESHGNQRHHSAERHLDKVGVSSLSQYFAWVYPTGGSWS